MTNRLRGRPASAIWAAAIAIMLGGLFVLTVHERGAWFGRLGTTAMHHHALTGSTLKFSRIWYREGPAAVDFALVELPASPERPDLASRRPYVSYSPATIVPIYLLAVLRGEGPDVALIQGWNLFNHLAVAWCLAAIAFVCARRVGVRRHRAAILSLLPGCAALLLPSPMYYFQNVYWADQAVILPWCLMVLAECFRGRVVGRGRHVYRVAWAALVFWGCLVDWLFPCAVVVLGVLRCWDGHLRTLRAWALFCVPPLAAAALYAAHLTWLGRWPALWDKFLHRSGDPSGGPDGEPFSVRYWLSHVAEAFGWYLVPVLWGGLLALVVAAILVHRRGPRRAPELTLAVLVLVPPFLCTWLLRGHAWYHDFTALRFLPAVALLPWVLAPLALRRIAPASRRFAAPALVLLAAAAGWHLRAEHPGHREFFFFREEDRRLIPECSFVDRATGPDDVVVSPHLRIAANPPQRIALAMTEIHRFATVAELEEFLAGIEADYHLRVYLRHRDPVPPDWERLIADPVEVRRHNGHRMISVER